MTLDNSFINATEQWLNKVIIAHNICPFAKRVVATPQLRFKVHHETDIEILLQALIDECLLLDANQAIETSLLIYANALKSFDDYLDFLAISEDLLIEQGYEGVYQLASFHPRYCFANAKADDAANYTNRSPYPMLHLLRESSIERAIEYTADIALIPERNSVMTRALGVQTWQHLLAACYLQKTL